MAKLTAEEKATYEWQIWVPDFGAAGQEKLKDATVLVSRCGGLGSVVAYELAAAGVGKLVVAHGGNVKHSDLNRQLLVTHDWLGKPRVESVKRRLLELNPRLVVEAVASNVNEQNAAHLVEQVDVVVDCAPLFEERFLMNREAVRQNKPLVECAMYDLEAHVYTVIPRETACVSCIYPNKPPAWKREFPVFGAVSGMVACLGAMEAIKLIAGFGRPLAGRMAIADLREMKFRELTISRRSDCDVCGD
jgi:molybdopterin/thiamine biosynthesis adenylyltransferase